jgi:hypothetical protein
MKRLILTIKENWNDPVWSKVIATVIISISGFLLTNIYALIQYLFREISFADTFQKIIEWLSNDIKLEIWIVIILVVIYAILMLKSIVKFLDDIKSNIKAPKNKTIQYEETKLPKASEYSTSLFYQRMACAFPGVRDITWFENPKIATKRLMILLKEPLKFSSGNPEFESDPFWWFRGGSALFIERFIKIGRKKVLMNFDQLKIKRIAAYHGNSYYKDFVYVETEGEKQTGLYKIKPEDIKRHIDNFGYSWEEYGLIKNWLGWKTPIRREEYDDGATVVRGKVKDALNAELRVRYISKYNFIIAAKGSPYNSDKFSRKSKMYLDGILKGEIKEEDFFNFLKGFQKHEK